MSSTRPIALTASPSASESMSSPLLVTMQSSMAWFHAELTYRSLVVSTATRVTPLF